MWPQNALRFQRAGTGGSDVRQRAAASRINGSLILWVDDHPDNDIYQRQALAELGVKFVLAGNTQEAMSAIRARIPKIDVIVSNFRRSGDLQAGYSLLAAVLKVPEPPPYIIYSGTSNVTLVAEAKAKGAFGQASRAKDLFELIISAVKKK